MTNELGSCPRVIDQLRKSEYIPRIWWTLWDFDISFFRWATTRSIV